VSQLWLHLRLSEVRRAVSARRSAHVPVVLAIMVLSTES